MALMQISDALRRSGLARDDEAIEDIKKKHGRATTTFFDAEQAFLTRCGQLGFRNDRARELVDVAYARFSALMQYCESPIERMMVGPLLMANYDGFGTIPAETFVPRRDVTAPKADVLLIPQFAFVRYRIDLAVIGFCETRGSKIVALECDGEDFHRDAEYERAKNALLTTFGVTVIHATGKQINSDAIGIAARVAGALVDWKAGEPA